MLPTTLDYPLFDTAHTRFRALHPDPDDIAKTLRDTGLAVRLTHDGIRLRFTTDQYLDMVRNRYMTPLSQCNDEQLKAGITEIHRRNPDPIIEFIDLYAFITATAP